MENLFWISLNILLQHLIKCIFIKFRIHWAYIWESKPLGCQPIFPVLNPTWNRCWISRLTEIIIYVITKVKDCLLSFNRIYFKFRIPYNLPPVWNIEIWLLGLINLFYSPHYCKSLSWNCPRWQVKAFWRHSDDCLYESYIVWNRNWAIVIESGFNILDGVAGVACYWKGE